MKSLTRYISVSKGDNMRIVYNGTPSGLNASL